DNLPPVLDIGPGSPTGVCFGYGAKFPAKYQNAFFICDWSYGKLYAVQLKPSGNTYTAEKEEFVTGTPLPLTDVVINPHDGAMYFTIGGRKTKSGLYRVTYIGNESTEPAKPEPQTETEEERDMKRRRQAIIDYANVKGQPKYEEILGFMAKLERFGLFEGRRV